MFSQHQSTPAPPPLHRRHCWCPPPLWLPSSAITLKHGRLTVRYQRGMANKLTLSLIKEKKDKHFLKQARTESESGREGGMGAWDMLEKVKTENCKVLAGDQLGASWDSERRDTMSQILIPLWFGNAPVTGERRHCWISEMFDIFIFECVLQANIPFLYRPPWGNLSVDGMCTGSLVMDWQIRMFEGGGKVFESEDGGGSVPAVGVLQLKMFALKM